MNTPVEILKTLIVLTLAPTMFWFRYWACALAFPLGFLHEIKFIDIDSAIFKGVTSFISDSIDIALDDIVGFEAGTALTVTAAFVAAPPMFWLKWLVSWLDIPLTLAARVKFSAGAVKLICESATCMEKIVGIKALEN